MYELNDNYFTPVGDEVGPFYVHAQALKLWDWLSSGYRLTRLGAEVAYWVHKNGPVWHSHDGSTKLKESDSHSEANNKHRFYFDTDKKRKAFIEAVSGMPTRGDLFPDFAAIELEQTQALNVTIYPYSMQRTFGGETLKLWFWVRDNCKGRIWTLNGSNLVFESVDDATLFKMNFAGTEK